MDRATISWTDEYAAQFGAGLATPSNRISSFVRYYK